MVEIEVKRTFSHIANFKNKNQFRIYAQNKSWSLVFQVLFFPMFLKSKKYLLKFICILIAGLFFVGILLPRSVLARHYSAQRFTEYTLDEEEDELIEDKSEETELRETIVKGTYRLNFGIEDKDFIWKDANYLLQEGSWRYFFGEKRHNTYDPAIYSNFKLTIDASLNEKLSFYTKIVVDPWSFVGKSKTTILPSWYGAVDSGDPVEVQLKYWSNSGRVFPEIVRSEKGDSFGKQDVKKGCNPYNRNTTKTLNSS